MHKSDLFRKFGIATIAAVYFLIIVGGIVRSTGSGMGCPDWPLCFGQWIPPTDISQLPPDYKEVFAVAGKEIADFNALHTWTEYVNRLIGAVIGLLIAGVAVFSLRFRKSDPAITALSFFTFVLVLFQAWLGSVVVSTDLKPVTITIHMLVALLIVGLLLYVVVRSQAGLLPRVELGNADLVKKIVIGGIILMAIQIILGTQVREGVDTIGRALEGRDREMWLDLIGLKFYVHRSFSILLLALHGYLWHSMKYRASGDFFRLWSSIVFYLLVAAGVSGALMGYFAIPAFLQPIHLLLSALIVGGQFLLLMVLLQEKFFSSTRQPIEEAEPAAISTP